MSDKVVSVRVSSELKDKIVAAANEEHRTIANFIIHCIMVYLDSQR